MHTKLVSLLACPDCSCDLSFLPIDATDEIIAEGSLRCTNCQRLFPIKAGIPYFLENEGYGEIKIRNNFSSRFAARPLGEVKLEISKHHYMALMEKETAEFSKRFKEEDWLLDAGIGWGWHWQTIKSPNIIGVDFSFSSLLISKYFLNSKIDNNVHLVCADIARLPLKDKAIDGIWSVQTLQHIRPCELPDIIESFRRLLKEKGDLQIYWLNFSHLFKMCYKLFKKKYEKEVFLENHFLKRITAAEVMNLFRDLAGRRKLKIRFNESIFHPDLKLIHNSSSLLFLEKILSSIPFLNSVISRQIVLYSKNGQ